MTNKNGALAPTGSACLEKVLRRLEKVKSAGTGKWQACCPAHDDKSPSLAIKETSDGTVLLKCWAGCSVAEVVSAVGLELRDLFPGGAKSWTGPSRAAIQHEQAIYKIGNALLENGPLPRADMERFNLAKQRLGVI